MKVLIAGANGYIASRLLPVLVEEGHEVIALVRSPSRLKLATHHKEKVSVVQCDLFDPTSLEQILKDFEAAYYLVHSMGDKASGFSDDEATCAHNFGEMVKDSKCRQIVYLSGLAQGNELSEHMTSRRNVETVLKESDIPVTVLRAGIIIGAGSASFEIIRDLVEKLPIMIAPRWVESRCQPIGISDVVFCLKSVIETPETLGKTFEIGGPEVLTYRQMLLRLAKMRGLFRLIIPILFFTPRLSSYWLFFITSTSYSLARALVSSLKTDAVCQDDTITHVIPHKCLSYEKALNSAFDKIQQQVVVSSWKDAMNSSRLDPRLNAYMDVPSHGCMQDVTTLPYKDRKKSIEKLWRIGGKNGWYYMDWAWRLRGGLDRLVMGCGIRRGRRSPTQLANGDSLDFWRVICADKENGHLLLYAEMRLPGEAWLDFRIEEGVVKQTATFRPKGVFGCFYWALCFPFHLFIFQGLCSAIAEGIDA